MLVSINKKMASPNIAICRQEQAHHDLQHQTSTIKVPQKLFDKLDGYLKELPLDVSQLRRKVNDVETQPAARIPPKIFPQFSKLPAELRVSSFPSYFETRERTHLHQLQLKIWELAYSTPRIVGVEFIHEIKNCTLPCLYHGPHLEEQKCTYLMPITPRTALLEVSAEARNVALKKSISLGSWNEMNFTIEQLPFPNIRFHRDHDTLWILDIDGFFNFWDPCMVVAEVRDSVDFRACVQVTNIDISRQQSGSPYTIICSQAGVRTHCNVCRSGSHV